jgi:hypothetical protein
MARLSNLPEGTAMLKFLLLAMSVAMIASSAHAQSFELSCSLAPSERQTFLTIGSPDSAQQVIHLRIDKRVRKVTFWETSPEVPAVQKSTYKAKFVGSTAAWSIGDPQGGPQAHDSVDLSSNLLTTVDPMGNATQWNCSGS